MFLLLPCRDCMKLLRWVLVIVLSWLIVWGLSSLTQDDKLSQSKIFSPLRSRLVSNNSIDQNWEIPQESDLPSDNKDIDWPSAVARMWEELIPELSYGSISTQSYNAIISKWSILGNKNADYLMIQYCDYSMKYCNQSQRDGALIAYQDALDSNLWYMLKPFLLDTNPNSEIQHHALQCAQKTWNDSQINRMHAVLFDLEEVNDIRKTGTQLKIEWFESCFLNDSSLQSLTEQRTMARDSFNISQLPSFVLIDTRSLDRTLIPGLYEEELVTAYLQQL